MKNYLGNLIARHMSQAEVLLPRLASRFEPQSSVLQFDEFQVETAEFDLAETLAGESEIVAPVFPITPEIADRVANPSLPLSHSPESVVESSGPVPVPVPTFAVANHQDYESTVIESFLDRVASTSRVQSDDLFGSESRSVSPANFATPTASEIAIDSGWTKTTDQIAVHDHVAERTPREFGPTAQPFTANETVTTDTPLIANEPLTAIEPVTANESVTTNEHEHVTEIERVTPSLRAATPKPNQPLTRRSIETQRAISTPATEIEKETVGPATSSESVAPTTKSGPFASGTKDEPFTSGVSYSKDDISVSLPKPQQTKSPITIEPSSGEQLSIERSSREHSSIERSSRELLSAVVVPERTENSPVVNTASEIQQAAPKQPETLPEEARLSRVAQRARQLETSVARPPVNDPRNVINPGNTRLMSHNDITPAEAGPTINVTIGRIEVRATTSEPRPQKQRREQQVLSLDEYLNQRSAGGR